MLGPCYLFDLQFDPPVVEQEPVTRLDFLGEFPVGDGDDRRITANLLRRQDEILSLLQIYAALFKVPYPDLRSREVLQDRDRKVQFSRLAAYSANHVAMAVVSTVGEIESRDVHSGLDQVPDHGLRFGRRSDRANDLGFSVFRGDSHFESSSTAVSRRY